MKTDYFYLSVHVRIHVVEPAGSYQYFFNTQKNIIISLTVWVQVAQKMQHETEKQVQYSITPYFARKIALPTCMNSTTRKMCFTCWIVDGKIQLSIIWVMLV